MTLFAGYLLAVLIGVCLGLCGSGGSILTVPVLVYVFRMAPVTGTSYSLLIVGLTSLAGLLLRLRPGTLRLRPALAFAIPSLTGVYLVRGFVIHALPPTLSLPAGAAVDRDAFIMVLFALVMAAAGVAMLKRPAPNFPAPEGTARPKHPPQLRLVLAGLFAGTLTGFVGAGGGFLIIPALVLLAGMPMEAAVGVSLAIISAQSLAGFAADWIRLDGIDWGFLAAFSSLSIAGAMAGGFLGRRVDGNRLRRVFACLILVMAGAILLQELLLKGMS